MSPGALQKLVACMRVHVCICVGGGGEVGALHACLFFFLSSFLFEFDSITCRLWAFFCVCVCLFVSMLSFAVSVRARLRARLCMCSDMCFS